jgi:acetyl-CoA carboxylase carboxyl transferase subunit beta
VPFISVLTNPTMAGIMASFAGLGDVTLAEPGALIGFTGPRVIKQTIKQDLPKGFQTAEFNLQHGMVDMVVLRKDLKTVISGLLSYLVPPVLP